jgi:penicillin-binding protein 1C
VHLSRDKKNRVHSACEPVDQIETVNWFVLSPVQEYFYRSKNVSYKTLPPFRADCINEAGVSSMDLIYPKPNARIFIPRGFDGTPGATVFELAHRQAASKVFWHLDGVFIGETRKVHQMAVNPGYGKHTLVLVDEAGDMLERHFEVLSKM